MKLSFEEAMQLPQIAKENGVSVNEAIAILKSAGYDSTERSQTEQTEENALTLELKTCPFCGSEAQLHAYSQADDDFDTEYFVSCTRCFAKTWIEETKENAVATWNRRAE